MDESTKEQWLELHEAFREYCQAAPWQWFDDTDIVTVQHPSGEQKGYCVVMGSGGIIRGLAVYLGDEGLAGYLQLLSGEVEAGSLDSLDRTNALSAMLADREELTKQERDAIRSLGLRYRGRGRWPLFQNFKPGCLPWRLEGNDVAFLTWALRSITDLSYMVEKGELALRDEDAPHSFLTRTFHDGQWHDSWDHLIMPLPPRAPDYADLERLRQLAESKSEIVSTWELGIFYLHTPLREEAHSRPYFPLFAMIVHTESQFVLHESFMEPAPSDSDRQELVVKLLETMPGLPPEIVVGTPRMAQLVESITEPLGIALSVDDTEVLWAVTEELFGFIDEVAEGS